MPAAIADILNPMNQAFIALRKEVGSYAPSLGSASPITQADVTFVHILAIRFAPKIVENINSKLSGTAVPWSAILAELAVLLPTLFPNLAGIANIIQLVLALLPQG